jgi:2-polyprenyl-6-methoxyphenol hydroxylase-like FAD-dependent oxidoreductase
MAPLNDGRVYWFAVISVDRDHRFDDDRAALIEHFGNWHDPIPELIAGTSPQHVGYLPINELGGGLRSYTRGRIVLLGDAAHAMTPNLGQGGGQAMEDASTLAALLAPMAASSDFAGAAVDAALARYDALRVSRTRKIAQRSHMIGQLAHAPGKGLIGARDLLLKATPKSALRNQLTWLQDWTPPS